MKTSKKLLIAAGFTFIVGAQVVFTVVLSTPNGVRISSPQVSTQVDPDFLVSGDAWMRGGLQRIEVWAAKANDAGLTPLTFIAQRDEVKYRGQALYPLSTWTARASLPGVGAWQIWALAVGQDGTIVETSKRKVLVASGVPSQVFRNWAPEHLSRADEKFPFMAGEKCTLRHVRSARSDLLLTLLASLL
jgi:hypothetical protein